MSTRRYQSRSLRASSGSKPVACKYCDTGRAVEIEPGLLSESPKNGNISNISRRLSTISR